ncbi:MAG: hypothetical protein FLDDKLPJ_03747 [Phycisphaerae bacterium]|nr:hypothetical protein [Phycisphaerae bacterium]
MRWDNILLLFILVLGIWATHQLVVVLSIHGDHLMGLYERTFSPRERPIVKLEMLVLIMVIVARMRLAARRRPPT